MNFVNKSMYITIPIERPKKRYNLNSPSLNWKIAEVIKKPEIIQNKMSSIYVIILLVLNFFFYILKRSNINAIIKPKTINIKKLYN